MTASRLTWLVLCLLPACATAPRPGAQVVTDAPEHCRSLGTVVASQVGAVEPYDGLVAAATEQVRAQATRRGASHVLVAWAGTDAPMRWSTTATVEGVALACSGER